MVFTNHASIPLAIGVWAVQDSYDYVDDPRYLSVTTLLKPTRQIILSRRVNTEALQTDVEDFVASAMGTSIHDSIEKAWLHHYEEGLAKLGIPENVIKRFKINPDPATVGETDIPVYLEQRAIKEFEGWKIGGKFDFVADGLLHDNKSTTTMKWTKGSSDKDYQLQGSLYRWLNPGIIKEDYIRINFIFTDWSKLNALKDSSYPQHRAMYRDIPLLTIPETENWLKQKLMVIEKYMDAPEAEIPPCPDEELWRTPTKYKYFANAGSQRATKNFDNQAEAYRYMNVDKKGQGFIRIVPGEARRCNYCIASDLCKQCPNKNQIIF